MKPNKRTIVARLRAFTAALENEAADRIESLEATVRQLGSIGDVCTWHELREVCEYCRCPHKAKRAAQSKKGA